VAAVEQGLALRPDVILMDIRMPRRDGIEATRQLAGTSTRVLVLTTFDLDEYVYAAVRAGASGFLLKDVSPTDLVHAVHVVARGEAMLAPSLTRRLLERFATPRPQPAEVARLHELSARETDVLRLIARGSSNAQIGHTLFLSEATVKTYVSRMLTKLDLRDRVQLAVFAYESGLVQVGG
jgi:DNA-binding NarL/FixJ family response regulator